MVWAAVPLDLRARGHAARRRQGDGGLVASVDLPEGPRFAVLVLVGSRW